MSGTLYQHTSSTKMTALLAIGILLMTAFMSIASDLLSTIEYIIALGAVLFCLFAYESVSLTIDSNSEAITFSRATLFTLFRPKTTIITRDELIAIDRVKLGKKKSAMVTTRLTYLVEGEQKVSPNLIVQDVFNQVEDDGMVMSKIVDWKHVGVKAEKKSV